MALSVMSIGGGVLALTPLGKLGIERCHGSLSGGRQQMPVHLVRHVDIPVPEEVSKLGDLHATREHRGSEGVA